jgi:hypothetical protein
VITTAVLFYVALTDFKHPGMITRRFPASWCAWLEPAISG